MRHPSCVTKAAEMRDGDLSVRPMGAKSDDLSILARWFADVRVQEFYEGRDRPKSIGDVRAEFAPRIRGEEPVEPCFIELQDRPIGFVQLYRMIDDPGDPRNADFPGEEDAWALDLFLEPERWGSGLGTRALVLITTSLAERRGATSVSVDPWIGNARAVRAYEKAGFRAVRTMPRNEIHEGSWRDAKLMVWRPGS
jgi:aminoglycoside 6'-N-acetyltransferase